MSDLTPPRSVGSATLFMSVFPIAGGIPHIELNTVQLFGGKTIEGVIEGRHRAFATLASAGVYVPGSLFGAFALSERLDGCSLLT